MDMFKISALFLSAFLSPYWIEVNASDVCNHVYKRGFGSKPTIKNCSTVNQVCKKEFLIIRLDDLRPYSDPDVVEGIIEGCCGTNCTKNHSFAASLNKFDPNKHLHIGHFVYPFLGGFNSNKLYGYHFVPVVEVRNGCYISLFNLFDFGMYSYRLLGH